MVHNDTMERQLRIIIALLADILCEINAAVRQDNGETTHPWQYPDEDSPTLPFART